ncbi:ABC transporter substrate-binding protein [Streptomyces sp. NPDC060194]|uniref:ABC transporter substrate-binding protein n=1 Tax=Streptomyces sp. NPDC060194 TaxID=3347069 RepID=UPI0036642D9B
MKAVGIRILASCAALAAAGVGAWQLLPGEEKADPVTVGTVDAVTSLDPAGGYDTGSWALYSNLFQSLLSFEPGGTQPVPDAASSCAFIGDGLRTYGCTLREGLKFSSGREVTAEDVKYSFDRLLAIDDENGAASLLTNIKSVEPDGRDVVFRLKTDDATFPMRIATGAGSIVDREEYPADKLREGTGVDGSGPYVLKKYKEKQYAELAPNPDYRGAAHKTGLPVTIRYFEDADALDASWQKRDVDVASRQLPPKVISDTDATDRDVRVAEGDSAEIRNLVLNVRKGTPFAQRATRQAAAWLVDRPEVASGAYLDTVEPLYSVIPRGIEGHRTPFFDAYSKPSVAKARKLLQESGAELPVKIGIGFRAGGGEIRKEASLIEKQLETGGLFDVDVSYHDWQDFQSGYLNGKFDAYVVGWLADYPDPDTFAQPLVGTENSLSNGYSNRTIDALVVDTQRYSARARAVDDFAALQREVARDVPLIPLWQRKDYVLSTNGVGGTQNMTDGSGVYRLWELERI